MIIFSATTGMLCLGVGVAIIIVSFFIYVASTMNAIIGTFSITFC